MFLRNETTEHNLLFSFLFSPVNALPYGTWKCFGYTVPGQEPGMRLNSWGN